MFHYYYIPFNPGSPAWAGIDPEREKAALFAARFPRVGGDRPVCGSGANATARVPPRGRG